VTVLDTSGAIDFLLGADTAADVERLVTREAPLAAPDLLVFEVLAVFRRHVQRGALGAERAAGAIDDLGEMAIELFPTLRLRSAAWELRENLTASDGMFAALAARLGEPLATKDAGLAEAARRHAGVEVIELGARHG
jgi:predicted nucleic acid-binding protein